MQLSTKGAAFVRAHEGFVPKYYVCPAGVGTIGVGFTWRSRAFRAWWKTNKGGKIGPGSRITKAEADKALRYMFKNEYGAAVNKSLDGKKIKQNVWDTMASMSYNCGAGALNWNWAKLARAGDIKAAAARLRKTAVTGGGKRLRGLVRRRKEEALLLEKGIYTGIGKVHPQEPVEAMADGILERGERGPEVAQLIRDLHARGHYDGVMDDVFGHGTEAALLEFQRANGLDDDGKAGPATLAALKAPINPVAPVAVEKDYSDPVIQEPVEDPSEEANEQIEELLHELDKPMMRSGTWLGALRSKISSYVTGGGTVYAFQTKLAGLDPKVQIAIIVGLVLIAGIGVWGVLRVLKDRSKYAKWANTISILRS